MTIKVKNIFLLSVIYLITVQNLFASPERENEIFYNLEANASFSGGENTPFWLVSNRHGMGSPEFNNGYVRGAVFKLMSSDKKFDWGAGVDLTGGWNIPAPFAIRQLYGELHYRKFWINFGSQNFQSPYNNRDLSSGNLLFSGNAMAIPQFRIGTNGFAPFWGTKGWFSVNIYLSYGMFTDSNWQQSWVIHGADHTKNALFCGRGLWLRGGNVEKFPLTFDVGIQMGTQFGGTIFYEGEKFKMPSKIMDWFKAVIPFAGDEDTPEGEQTNVQGNMTGEYNISVAYSPTPDWDIRIYWEHYFEDQSQMTFEYGTWKDGLWGIELGFPKNRFISRLVYENIYTKDQTGPINHDYSPEIPEQVSGGDNYYNHYLYGAWQTWGMTIGTPLAISPLYNRLHRIYIYNNRFAANHIGIEGDPIDWIHWRALFTFSQNWGTYRFPFKEVMNNFSGLVEVNFTPAKLKGWYAKAAIAWDKGKLLGNNFGGMISVGKTGLIKW